VVAFAIMAAIAAGNDLPSGLAAAVTAIGVLGIEVGGLIFGFSATNAVGLALVLVVSLLAGRNRRDARIRAAQAAALVTRTQQAQADQRRAAALEERTRIAREIHDVLAQSLSALGVQIEAARSVLSDTGDIGCATGLLEQASQLADAGLGETRQAIHALRADTPPLPGGIASLAESHEQQWHHPVVLSVTGQALPVRPEANIALIRAAREALTNAAKHATGAAVTSRESDVLVLIAQGLSNSEIAAALFLSANTVKTHINRVFAKTGSKTRAQAIRYALDHGLAGGGRRAGG
jgi:signal transduction histidine kinase